MGRTAEQAKNAEKIKVKTLRTLISAVNHFEIAVMPPYNFIRTKRGKEGLGQLLSLLRLDLGVDKQPDSVVSLYTRLRVLSNKF